MLKGVYAPVLTPFHADLSPDAARLVAHGRWLLAQGCGLALFGTTSEATSLSVEEREELLDALVDAGLDSAGMMVGTGCCALPDTVRLTAHAVRRGCGGVLMLPPFYYKGVGDDGLFRAFAEVIERVGDSRLRVYLYHFPRMSAVPLSLALVERLVKAYPRTVVGLKDSSGDWANTEALLKALPGFAVFPGSETLLLPAMRAGGAGCISATANVNAAAIRQLYANWQAPEAEAMQERLIATRRAFEGHPMIAALKAALADARDDHAWRTVRPPLTALDAAESAALAADLEAVGFRIPV